MELTLEDLLVAVAEEDDAPIDEGRDEPSPEAADAPALRRRPRVSDTTPRERRELDPGTCCPDCGGDLRIPPEADDYMRTFGATGEDVSELLDMIAAQMKVIQIARIKKSCRRCERMVQESAPSRPIPGSMAGPNLLAHVLVSKFDDHLPSVIGRVWSMVKTVQRAGPYFCPWSARRHKMRTVEVGKLQSCTSALVEPWVNPSLSRPSSLLGTSHRRPKTPDLSDDEHLVLVARAA